MATSVTLKANAIDIAGTASGTVTLQAPSAAGTTTLTLPSTSGTILTSASTATTTTNLAGGSNGTIPYQSASGTTQMLAVGTTGQVLQTNGAGAPTWVTPSSFTYPGAGIANSTGSAWGTSYSTTGSGTVVALATNPTITNYTESVVAIGTVTSSNTLSLTSGTIQTATLTASTACTFTMPTATAGKSFVLLLKQAASTGNGTATFTSVKWNSTGAPTITATAGKMDILTFFSDGTNWYGSYSQGYTP